MPERSITGMDQVKGVVANYCHGPFHAKRTGSDDIGLPDGRCTPYACADTNGTMLYRSQICSTWS